MKIAFHSNQLGELGTEVAIYDYAHYNETLLNNRSIIIAPRNGRHSALEKFRARFDVFLYEKWSALDEFLYREKCTDFYAIKPGKNDGIVSKVCRNLVHCVFEVNAPHGDIYAAISRTVANQSIKGVQIPVVPHMVSLPRADGDMRAQLGIPATAVVFGRYGGAGSFDIPFVYRAVYKALINRPDAYFIFANTPNFLRRYWLVGHPRIIFLPPMMDLHEKSRFINSCDAMLHARHRGETFGLAIAEFSSHDKPVFAWNGSHEREHLDILKDKAIAYQDEVDLLGKLVAFDVKHARSQSWDRYSADFSPEKVMVEFDRVFLAH